MALCFQPSSQNASTLIAKRPFKKIFSWPACKQGVSMFHLVSSVPCDRKRAVCFSSLMSSPSWPPHQSRMALSAKPPSSRPVQTARSPPTPALAKARAAPGTTGGVEPALSRPWPPYSSNNCLSVFQRFAKPQRPHPSKPSAGLSKATVAATRPSHLFLRAFKTAVCPPSNLQTFPQAFPRQLSQLLGTAICFSGRSRLPFTRLQTSQTLPQAFPRQLSQLRAPAICF